IHCGYSYSDIIPLKEHTMGELVIETEATVDADGLMVRTCKICGKRDEEVIPRILNFKNKTLALQSNISLVYRVDPVYFTKHGYSNPVVIFMYNGVEYPVSTYDVNKTSGLYEFKFSGLAPHQMKDKVSAVLRAEYDGETYTSDPQEHSIYNYCNEQINKYYNNASYKKLVALLVDILNYGAAAQKYKGYKTDDLANANLTDAQKALGNQEVITYTDEKNMNYKTVDNGIATFKAVGLALSDSVIMTFKFELAAGATLDGVTAHIEAIGKKWDIPSSEFTYEASTGRYVVSFAELNPAQMRNVVVVNLVKDGNVVSNSVTYSIESYGLSKAANQATTLKALVEAMARYGRSAKAYVG
ncbi:MAG: hypothetical protein IKJ50_07375, partial [Clostridia bacterium]|nr:hypothetical protein [Clostridia bacterium]